GGDLVTGVQTCALPISFGDGDRTHADLVVAPDHGDLMTSLKLDDCPLRNQQGAILRLRGCANAPVTTRTKEIVWISKEAGDANRPGGGIHLPIGERDASLVFINVA